MLIRRNEKLTAKDHTLLGCVKNGREYEVFYNAIGHEYIIDDLDSIVLINEHVMFTYFDVIATVPAKESLPWPQVGDPTSKGKVLANYKGYTWVLVCGIAQTFLTAHLEKPKPTLAAFIDSYLSAHTGSSVSQLDLIRDAIGDFEND
jgi:hypothetical protein